MCGNPQAISQFHNSPLKNIDVQILHEKWDRLVLYDFSLELILMELLLSKHSYFIFLLLFVSEKVLKKLPCAVFLLSTHGHTHPQTFKHKHLVSLCTVLLWLLVLVEVAVVRASDSNYVYWMNVFDFLIRKNWVCTTCNLASHQNNVRSLSILGKLLSRPNQSPVMKTVNLNDSHSLLPRPGSL